MRRSLRSWEEKHPGPLFQHRKLCFGNLPGPDGPGKAGIQWQKVAVIGAGPAGITVAVKLAAKGYGVIIFEWQDKIGGILQYGIPEFRLPKSLLERYRKQLEAMRHDHF